MEGGPREHEITRESQELIKSPEQVFDSDVEKAKEQHEAIMDRLRGQEKSRRYGDVTFETREIDRKKPPEIRIGWTDKNGESFLLVLEPLTEGRGMESGVFGYVGSYGVAQVDDRGYNKTYKFSEDSKHVSLEELFAVPEGLRLIIQLTKNRWAMEGKNSLTESLFGEGARQMYMGLGFLLLGREWLHIGMHEAGHLTSPDENKAWSIANSQYAQIARPRKEDIKAGEYSGEFGLLKPQQDTSYGKSPKLGDIAMYGLTSHARAGGARIPSQWDKDRINNNFERIIKAADEACEEVGI